MPRAALAILAISGLVTLIMLGFQDKMERNCRKSYQMLESFERCKTLEECIITRDDIAILIVNETYIERRECGVIEDE